MSRRCSGLLLQPATLRAGQLRFCFAATRTCVAIMHARHAASRGSMAVATVAACTYAHRAVLLCVLPAVLEMPLAEVKVLCCREAPLLTLRPELVGSKLQLWSDVLGVQRSVMFKAVKVSLLRVRSTGLLFL